MAVMAIGARMDRMRGREIVRALSLTELISLCLWCILALVLKLVNLGFAGLDRVLGKRFDEFLVPSTRGDPPPQAQPGEPSIASVHD